MRITRALSRLIAVGLILLMVTPLQAMAQASDTQAVFRQEQLDQMLAPIALYPDSLLAQIFMASTYPLEIVQADRWVKQHEQLQGDALADALEKQNWDPSVKSLVNFPQILAMMSEQLDWTTNLGDAFLAQQEDVLDTVQQLRAKAQAAGNLHTTTEHKVIVEQQVIRIEPVSPQVVYVPVYNPTVVYGSWWYPAYPPRYYYPPGYVAGAALFSFGVGVAVGSAWGYAWGGCNWHQHYVDVNINRNVNMNRNINRSAYRADFQRRGHLDASGRGTWQHNASHRKGVAYHNQATAQQFNRSPSAEAVRTRQDFRGRAEAGRQDQARGGTGQPQSQPANRQSAPPQRRVQPQATGRGEAFEGIDRGRAAQTYSHRGQASRRSMGGSRGGNIGGGASRDRRHR